jgi:hypothetical protein
VSNERSLIYCSTKIYGHEIFRTVSVARKRRLGIKTGRKHIKYVKPGFPPIPVGRHPSKEVPTGTLNAIFREGGLF